MGVGLTAILAAADADAVLESARLAGVNAWHAGDVVPGTGAVRLDGR
jgi:phosphoribosylaminoimidazole (AIR) synthetase